MHPRPTTPARAGVGHGRSTGGGWRRACLLAMVLHGLAGPCAAAPDTLRVTIGGASAGGFYSLVGETVAQMVRAEYPGSSVGYEPGSQAGQLVRAVRGQVELAMVTPVELQLALRGEPPFRRVYRREELPVIGRIIDHQDVVIFIAADVADRYQIRSLADIAERKAPLRISFYPRGNLFGRKLVAEGIFGAYGITEEALRRWGGIAYSLASSETKRLMLDRRVDVWIAPAFHPDAKTLEIARAIALRPLAVDRAVIDRVAARYGLGTRQLPAGTYDFLPEDYDTPEVPSYLLASPRLPERDGYRIARAIHRHFDRYRAAHPYFAEASPGMLVRTDGYRLHPGAARYYREAGLLPAAGTP